MTSTNRTDPKQGAYNGFSLTDRFAASAWAKAQRIRPPKVPVGSACMVCGQTEGLIYWHSEDYRTPVDAMVVCAWCHWALHSRLKSGQSYVWPRWLEHLRRGYVPPPCPFGTRWQTWAARYLRTPTTRWDWTRVSEGAALLPLPAVLIPVPCQRVPWPFRLCEGDAHLPGQFNSIEATGTLQVFDGFDPPLAFKPWSLNKQEEYT